MLRKAEQPDAHEILQHILASPEFVDDLSTITPEFISQMIDQCHVYVGIGGVFIANQLYNEACVVHPLWKADGARQAMEFFLSKLPHNLACGFVPSESHRVVRFFEKCGFERAGILHNSIRVDGKLQDQIIYQREKSW